MLNWGKKESECHGNMTSKSPRVELGEATLGASKGPSITAKERPVERKQCWGQDEEWVHLVRWPSAQSRFCPAASVVFRPLVLQLCAYY